MILLVTLSTLGCDQPVTLATITPWTRVGAAFTTSLPPTSSYLSSSGRASVNAYNSSMVIAPVSCAHSLLDFKPSRRRMGISLETRKVFLQTAPSALPVPHPHPGDVVRNSTRTASRANPTNISPRRFGAARRFASTGIIGFRNRFIAENGGGMGIPAVHNASKRL